MTPMAKILKTIGQLQAEYEQGLANVLTKIDPRLAKYFPRVSFVSGRRKKRADASAENWSPDSGEIRIRVEPVLELASGEEPARIRGETLSKTVLRERG